MDEWWSAVLAMRLPFVIIVSQLCLKMKRMELYKTIEGIDSVILQNDMLYDDVIEYLHPDYVIHGDNWKEGAESAIRTHVEKLVIAYGGQIIDVPYTFNEDVKKIDLQLKEKLSMPEYRRKRLRQLITMTSIVKAMEAHSGLTGLIVEKTLLKAKMVSLINLMPCGFQVYVIALLRVSRISNLWI